MSNQFKNQEQRERWNKYLARYSHENYKTVTIKLNKKEYADIIQAMEATGKGASVIIKELLKKEFRGE